MNCQVCGQNMTEGPLTPDNRKADLFFGQEVNQPLVRREFHKMGMKTYLPKRDPHQCLAWDPKIITITDTGWDMFHRSAKAEGWKFASPARGLIHARGFLTEHPEHKIALGGWWPLNSWGKSNAEGPARRKIVETTSLPVVEDFVRRMHKQDRTIIMQADANNIHWPGHLPGMTPIFGEGLDRMWVSTHGVLHVRPGAGLTWHGERTGVGPDHQHESLNAVLSLKRV